MNPDRYAAVFSRQELQAYRDVCLKLALCEGLNMLWIDAYSTLAVAFDACDALYARMLKERAPPPRPFKACGDVLAKMVDAPELTIEPDDMDMEEIGRLQARAQVAIPHFAGHSTDRRWVGAHVRLIAALDRIEDYVARTALTAELATPEPVEV